ncbi:hypothetical protein PPL_12182 [Heterostelium album PN500]|uniref:Uncharacterized protein n=1 Tax=Heterostelium pallidum (strain ATCC 26659 / Pp 5 / PN500) TaxID=670386 RepID=D3BLX8_HETP5|nr:hypothetical protein PPL_12182 [Heterostelium album PN500]EFA77579.1 hypothetical protein PPL_12182 [Heterostelium album PN500]|eukprot:XP_020429707.1 hypothetical protein PPL_12182 [Heterostelium album PN500]
MEEKLVIEGSEVKSLLFKNDTPSDLKPIVKNDIDILKPKTAFILKMYYHQQNASKYIIDKGEELGFDELKHYKSKDRGNVRTLVKTPSLSEVVLDRIRPYFEEIIDIKMGSQLAGPAMRALKIVGKWQLDSINDLWRLCSVLVFQHDMWHDGDTVKDGLKYIIRSDVMYKRLVN